MRHEHETRVHTTRPELGMIAGMFATAAEKTRSLSMK